MIAVIGSGAARQQGLNLGHFGDLDIVGTYANVKALFNSIQARDVRAIDGGKKLIGKAHIMVEAELCFEGNSSSQLLQLIMDDPKTVIVNNMYHASLDVCYMLKMTHRFKKNSPHFLKTMSDIHKLRKAGATIRPEHQEFYERRLKETLDYGHPNLNTTKKQFFTDSVPYVYDHDSIHLAVAKLPKPAYNYYKPDENEVYCSREMFEQADIAIRVLGVYEEACVLALERSQIPHPETDVKRSFDMALEKVCTSITSGWFREFAWTNYYNVQKIYEHETQIGRNYLRLFHQGLAKGIIIPYRR